MTQENKNGLKPAPRWKMLKNVGPHTMPDGTEVVPGQVIRAFGDELRSAKDKFVCLDTADDEPERPQATLKPVHIGNDKWNVVNENNKPINDRPLSYDEAVDLINGVLDIDEINTNGNDIVNTIDDPGKPDNIDGSDIENAPTIEPVSKPKSTVLSDREIIKNVMKAMIKNGNDLNQDGSPELPVLKRRVKSIKESIEIGDALRDELFDEIKSEE